MPSFAQAFAVALAGCSCRVESGPATMPCAPISASHSRPSSSALALLITTTAQAPSEICEEVPAVMVPSLAKAGRSPPRLSAVVEGVLLLTGELVGRGVARLGQPAHGLLGGLVEQRIVGHRVDQRGVAVLEALTRLRQQVRSVGHRLHAARDDDVGLAGADHLVGGGDGVEARQAHLVDGDGGDRGRQPTGEAGGAGGVLAGAGEDDLAHDQVVDLLAGDARLLQRALDGDPAEVGGREALEPAEQAADRGARPGDDDGSGHGVLLQCWVGRRGTRAAGAGPGPGQATHESPPRRGASVLPVVRHMSQPGRVRCGCNVTSTRRSPSTATPSG